MSNCFRESVKSCIDLIAKMDYLFQAGAPCSLNASAAFKHKSRKAIYYKELYEVGVTNQDFNLMMKDLSYFQFTENTINEDVRLTFYPNPFQFVEYKAHKETALTMLDNQDLSQDEYDQLLSECDFTCDIPVIRYDLSIKQHCEKYHPAAHLHIGFNAENRWPVSKILTPYAFMLKILMHYYPRQWIKYGEEEGKEHNILDILYREELSRCAVIPDEFYSEIEKHRLVLR